MSSETKEQTILPAVDESTIPTSAVDASGRLRPETEEERRFRNEKLKAFFNEFDQMTDESDTPEIWAEIFRNIDEGRPQRPLFRGFY